MVAVPGHTRTPWSVAILGSIALGSAMLFAIGPARTQQASVLWQPILTPDTFDVQVPLVLTSGTPLSLEIHGGCDRPFILSTDNELGIIVSKGADTIGAMVGGVALGEWPVTESCSFRFHTEGRGWMIELDGAPVGSGETNAEFVVRFLRLNFDGEPPSQLTVEVEPRAAGTTPSGLQYLLGSAAVSAAALAIWFEFRTTIRGWRLKWEWKPRVSAIDAMVAVGLLLGALLVPPFFDDGWVAARLQNFSELGHFNSYYGIQATELPLAYWYEAIQLAVVLPFESPFWQRLPIVIMALVGWYVVRSTLQLVSNGSQRPPTWVAAGFYVAGFAAWGVTLRPEPVVSLFVVLIFSCMLRFERKPGLGYLAASSSLAVLSITLHPAGVVALAPVIVYLPAIVKYLAGRSAERPAIGSLVGTVAAVISLAIVIFFLDTDLAHKLHTASVFGSDVDHILGVRDEWMRYSQLDTAQYSPAVRRGVVGLMLLLVTIPAVRILGGGTTEGPEPALALGVGLLLLSVTPSKWPWHFGTLLALATVTIAVELKAGNRARHKLEWIVVTTGLIAISAWSWAGTGPFNMWGLRTLAWDSEPMVFLESPLVWVFVGLTILLVRSALRTVQLNVSVAMTGFAVASWLLVTGGVFVVDAIVTDGWTFTKQNLLAAVGKGDCGLGEETQIPVPGSLRPLLPVSSESGNATDAVAIRSLWVSSIEEAYRLPPGTSFVGHFVGPGTQELVTVPSQTPLEISTATFTDNPDRQSHEPVRLVVHAVDSDAQNHFVLSSHSDETIDSSRPFALELTAISNIEWSGNRGLLIHPDLRQYIPCATQPSISAGVARPPAAVIPWWGIMEVFWPFADTGEYVLYDENDQLAPVYLNLRFLSTGSITYEALSITQG